MEEEKKLFDLWYQVREGTLEREQFILWYQVREGTFEREQFILDVAATRQQIKALLAKGATYEISVQDKKTP